MNIKDILVRKVDKEVLITFLNIQLKENEKLHVENFCIFENLFVINIDCCFSEIKNQHINDNIIQVIEIECRIKKYTKEGSYTIRMDKPDFVKVISLSDYLSISSEVKLIDFIRFNYNPRIINNQKLLMKHIELRTSAVS